MSGVWTTGLPMTTWRNVYAVIDDGRAAASVYSVPEAEMMKLALRCRSKIACLVVIPADAVQPSEEARRQINASLERLAPSLYGVAWVVEGRGFQSAVARATLSTMALTRRRLQAWKVVANVDEGLGWLVSRSTLTDVDIQEGVRTIQSVRTEPTAGTSVHTKVPPKTTRRWAWRTNDTA